MNRLYDGDLDELNLLLLEGNFSEREVARRLGVHRATVHRYRIMLDDALSEMKQEGEDAGPIACACGVPLATHPAWCRVRAARSPAIQAQMQKLHQRAR